MSRTVRINATLDADLLARIDAFAAAWLEDRVWEMTWSFASSDGRATFEFVTVEGETRVRWRRIGRHRIFSDP